MNQNWEKELINKYLHKFKWKLKWNRFERLTANCQGSNYEMRNTPNLLILQLQVNNTFLYVEIWGKLKRKWNQEFWGRNGKLSPGKWMLKRKCEAPASTQDQQGRHRGYSPYVLQCPTPVELKGYNKNLPFWKTGRKLHLSRRIVKIAVYSWYDKMAKLIYMG